MFSQRLNDDLQLALLMPEFAPALFELVDQHRQDLAIWLPWPPQVQGVEDSLAYIREQLHKLPDREGLTLALLWQGQLAGVVSINWVDWRLQSGYLGYWLAPPYRGHGLMGQALTFLIDYAFSHWQLAKLEIRAACENIASRRLAERLGFQLEGTIRRAECLHGHYVDHALYGLLRQEWQPRSRSASC